MWCILIHVIKIIHSSNLHTYPRGQKIQQFLWTLPYSSIPYTQFVWRMPMGGKEVWFFFFTLWYISTPLALEHRPRVIKFIIISSLLTLQMPHAEFGIAWHSNSSAEDILNGRRTTDDDGRQSIAIGHQSNSGWIHYIYWWYQALIKLIFSGQYNSFCLF